jgi:two-component system OmpR family response regulator
VLLIEEEPIARGVLCELLTASGFEMRAVATWEDAVAVAATFLPDVLVTDWLLREGRSGFVLANSLVRANSALHAVFVTELPRCCLCVDGSAIRLKSYEILHKPVAFDHLEARLRAATLAAQGPQHGG